MKGPAELHFATSNKGKFDEASVILQPYGIRLVQHDKYKPELQSDDLEFIAREAARSVAAEIGVPVLAEDSGLFVDALRGFPGPYSAYALRTIGIGGLLKLLADEARRQAEFRAVVAYCQPGSEPISFLGRVEGRVVAEQRGSQGFGFDPVFVPRENSARTFAEMSKEEKGRYSHRAEAFRRFAEWFTSVE
jgi:XTP/dITP diphosphohydrolase